MVFRIAYYADVVHHDETSPVRFHGRVYPSLDVAEGVARAELAAIRNSYGAKIGYAIFDTSEGHRTVAIGPGVEDDFPS